MERPVITRTFERHIARLPITVPRSGIREVMGPGLAELREAAAAQQIAITGPWFVHHLRFDPEVFDFEIGIPLARAITAQDRVLPGVRPALTVVRAVHVGGYEQLHETWREFHEWIRAQGHEVGPDFYETYAVGPESGLPPAQWRTEYECALVRLGEATGRA